jgi:hypothetical protein
MDTIPAGTQYEGAETKMPRVFRVMRKDADGKPTVSPTSLGVRSGTDVDLDPRNNVLVNGKGMSVAPNWRDININRIPKRLRPKMPGAGGSNNTFCFRAGTGPFQQGAFASGLTLEPDSATHGNVTPAQVVPLATYETDLAATRPDWQEDET